MILQTISVQLLTDTSVVAMLRHKHDSTHPFSSGQFNEFGLSSVHAIQPISAQVVSGQLLINAMISVQFTSV